MAAAENLVLPFRFLILAIIASFSVAYSSTVLPPDLLFKDVVQAIARKEGWDPDAVRVSKFASGSVRLARSRKLELQVRTGKSTLLVFTFPEELDGGTWRKPRRRGRERGWRRLDKPLRWPRPRLQLFELTGPLEVKAVGDDRLSILLPMNATRTGLRRIVVGRGIRIKVKGAEEISLSYSSATEMKPSWFAAPSLCSPLLSLSISGPASIVAFKNHNPRAYIENSFQSPENLELLPDKCYHGSWKKDPSPAIISIFSQMRMPENLLRMILGGGGMASRLVKARMMAFALVRFKVEVEREIRDDDKIWSQAPEWKSTPAVEREWFEILSRAGAGTALMPVFERKLMRAPLVWDSVLLGSLLPNVSFTQLHSLVRPPEVFTLDVKW